MTLEIITSDLLTPLRHGFFTRKGGASTGIFEGLNCGRGSSDQDDVVALNRQIAARALGVEPAALVSVHQVHSADVARISDARQEGATPVKADAMVTDRPGLALGILTADCLPVLFADHEAGVIGAAHAGWKGALDGVLEATVAEMVALGARRERVAAALGPCISLRAYEVGPEFLDRFLSHDDRNGRFFTGGKGDRAHFDLPAYAASRLAEAGVERIDRLGLCTYSDPDRFYSYRRSVHRGEVDYGRLLSAITLTAA